MIIFIAYLVGLLINTVGLQKTNPELTLSQCTVISLIYPISASIALYSFVTARLLGVGMSVVCFVQREDFDDQNNDQKNDDLSL